MRQANLRYYSSKGKAIYSDFSTFAQGKALAKCNAIEFCHDFSKRAAPVVVCEYGMGKGDFAKNFLDEVKKRDKKLYAKTRYYLFDISEKMLSSARKTLLPHRSICIFGIFNAVSDPPFLPFDYCRINELLSDLPAELYFKNDGQISSSDGKPQAAPGSFILKFMERIDERRKIPFNFAAESFLLELCRLGKKNFRIDIFDYGFYSADDALVLPVQEWNRIIAREYGSQVTVDLNFLQMTSSLHSQNIPAALEKQKDYAEAVLGVKLELTHTKAWLDYSKANKKGINISEDDGFYHLRIWR